MKTKLFTLGVIFLLSTGLAAQTSGTCGPNLTWSLSNGVLTISGTGPMNDFTLSPAPWLENRSSISSVVIDNGVTSIGVQAFEMCNALTVVNIPNSVTSIGSFAFMACRHLTTLSIPKSVTSIGARAFGNCDSLSRVEVYNPVPITIIGQEDWGSLMIFYTNPSTGIAIPNNLTIYVPCASLDAYKSAMYWSAYASRMESLPLPSVICNVNDSDKGVVNTFFSPTACDSVILTAIPYNGYSFSQWSDGNTDNPRYAHITRDTTFTAEFIDFLSGQCGDSLSWNFSGDTLYFSGNGDMYNYSSSVPWAHIMNQVVHVSFAPDMTSVSEGAFYRAGNLSSIVIPNKVSRIESRAFLQCNKLSSVSFGSELQTIGDYTFAYCGKINTMTSYNITPPAVGMDGFRDVPLSTILFVPSSALGAYKQHQVWGMFDVRPLDSAIDDITQSPSSLPLKILENGHLYILLPDGTRYSAAGQRVK